MSVEQLKRCWRNKRSHVRDLLHKEKSYRRSTRRGVDFELEKATSKGLSEMTEMDVKIARLLGKEASFLGLRTAVSNVARSPSASPPLSPLPISQACSPAGASPPPPRGISPPRDSSKRTEELSKQLSTFDSVSEDRSDSDQVPRRRSKSKLTREQLQLIKEQRELVRVSHAEYSSLFSM
ncbi:hypothetical protein Aduo_002333 [Ancylostoma duodenale]